jgi:hypothetical protein
MLSSRDESLQKQKTTARIRLKRFQFQIEELIENFKVNNLVEDSTILDSDDKLVAELESQDMELKRNHGKIDLDACE